MNQGLCAGWKTWNILLFAVVSSLALEATHLQSTCSVKRPKHETYHLLLSNAGGRINEAVRGFMHTILYLVT
jgi:hypothetical protein